MRCSADPSTGSRQPSPLAVPASRYSPDARPWPRPGKPDKSFMPDPARADRGDIGRPTVRWIAAKACINEERIDDR